MSQTAIPLEFERYLQNQISVGDAPDMNEMIFAYIPGLDPSQPINRNNGLPDVSLWVHQQDVDQVGKLGDNALAYSVVIPGTVAEFTFNAIYLRDKSVPNSCGMVVHKAEETKENGMASTKSLVQAYDGAAQIAGITVDASTWQIDYQARLKGMEEDHRLACLDNYGHTAFVDGFDVTQQADLNKYKVTPGVVYVGGLRGVLAQEKLLTITTKPNGIYVDVVRQGTALSVWENLVTIAVSETKLTDYVDGQGNQHYVAKLAGINADGSVVDWRVKGGLAEHENNINPHPQYIVNGDNFTAESFTFYHHYQSALLLLIPYLADLKEDFVGESEVVGRLVFRRGSDVSSERFEDINISAKSSYDRTNFGLTKYHNGWDWEFCAVTYNGNKWLALKSDGNVQDARVSFYGTRKVEAAGYDKQDQFKVLTFKSSSSDFPPTNPELVDLITPLTQHSNCLLDQHGTAYFSHSNPPLPSDVGSPDVANTQFLKYDVSRAYRTGDVVWDMVDGQVKYFQVYRGPNAKFKGIDPKILANRMDGWKSQDEPWYWIEYAGGAVGQSFDWLSETPPAYGVIELGQNLPVNLYWRLAAQFPELVSDGHINTGDIVNRYVRAWGPSVGHDINSTLENAVERHNHMLPTGQGSLGTEVYGVRDDVWNGYSTFNADPVGGRFAVTADIGANDGGQIPGNFDTETRPQTIWRSKCLLV